MLTWTLLVLFLGLLYWLSRKPSSLPPGRWGLPIIGYIPLYTSDVRKIISDLREKYGDIFTWKVGSHVMVFFCDYELIKTTFNRPECQGRPSLFSFSLIRFHENAGILYAVGDVWVQGRRFALKHLKDFGMGKSSLEGAIQYEAQNLVGTFERTSGKPIEISWCLNVAVLNVIWKLVANIRYDTDDQEIIKFNTILRNNIDLVQGRLQILDAFPYLVKMLPRFVLDKVFKVKVVYDNMEKFKNLMLEIIETHVKTLDPNNPKDYIDAYLIQIQKERGNLSTMSKEDYFDLVITLDDFFGAGSETTSSTIRWLIALLATHPEIQTKMQKEIDEVVPRDTLPSLQDKDRLPYTEAVILEVMRYASFIPIGIMHATTEEIQVGKYRLPKNTAIFASARSCHRNQKYFERPEEFYPEHFLDKEGKVIMKKEGFLPFSLGRRQCLGESLARMELFIFATSLFQRFTASPPKGGSISLEPDCFQPLLSFIPPYEVVLTKRT
ncbi:cytochrome P450 2L1-like isoform X1 [Macrobrachium nipponense]|uniref:cytochrome P450 2L1-like isoform X1 n=1 Tax=Macrobrachium nipponense TaxID=159736 RepID=UPI0030C7E128